jgi:uncharacterized coiled-coil protein SlyX
MTNGNNITEVQKIIAQLEKKRAVCIKHGTELNNERANVALDAHTGDAKARKRLDEINVAVATHQSELQSLDAALRAAADKLAKARDHEARSADRALANEVKKVCEDFVASAERLDALGAEYAENAEAMEQLGARG